MYTNKLTLITLVMLIALAIVTASAKADCGKVTIAEMNWASAQLAAHIDKHVLAVGFNCDVKLVPGDTMPTVTSMLESSNASIAPELWELKIGAYTLSPTQSSLQLKTFLDTAKRDSLIRDTGKIYPDNARDGFWIPAQILKQYPSLSSIDGVLEHPELFPHPEDPNRSAFYACPVEWDCHTATTNLYHLYKFNSYGFDLIIPDSGSDLAASMSSANEQNRGWFGYYWEPTAPLGKNHMIRVRLSEKGYDFESMYVVKSYVSSGLFENRNVMQYLHRRQYPNHTMSQLLSRKEEMQMTESDTVQYFFRNYEYLWGDWVTPYTSAKIKLSLN